MARTRTTIGGRIVQESGPCNAVPSTSQDSSAVANNPVLNKNVTPSANLGVCHTNADKASEQSEAQKMDSNQHGVDMAENSRLVKEDVSCQPTNFSMNDISSSSSATTAPFTLPNNPPFSDLQAMLKYWMEKEERERRERKLREERERREREAREERNRQEREKREEKDRQEREIKREKERKEREKERKEHERHLEFRERVMDEYEKQMKRLFGIESAEEKTVTTTTSENKAEPEIKPEESTMSEKASELESFQTDLDSKDSPWDGPQDNGLIRDMAIDSAEIRANECAEKVCCEAMDAFTSMDNSLDSNLTLVGENRSTPEPERRLDATMSENPSASGPSWIFQSPESGENSGNPNVESQIIEAQLCDDFFRNSLPMVFMAKNRTVTVTKIGVVQFLGENSTSFSATQCSIPYNKNCYGCFYDSPCSISSCGSCREWKTGSVWFPSSINSNEVFRTVKSENLRRRAGNQYYPVSTVKSSTVICESPKGYVDAEIQKNQVYPAARKSSKLRLAKRTLKFTPMMWSLALNCSSCIAIGAYRSSVAMFPPYLTQPPGSQKLVIWAFKLEFGIT